VILSCCHSTNDTPSVSLCSTAPPLGSQGPRCPLWGWCPAQRIKITMIAGGNHTSVSCREAAKGVPSVTLNCCHSTNDTPSVSLCSTAPPLGSQGPRCPLWGWCREAAKGVSSVILSCCHSTNDTPSVSLCSTAPPLGSQGPRCPLWGKCREAAKGVPSVTLSCYHSTNDTPSVSLCSTAPPPGSQGCTPSSSILFTKCFLTLRGSFAIIRGDFGRGRR